MADSIEYIQEVVNPASLETAQIASNTTLDLLGKLPASTMPPILEEPGTDEENSEAYYRAFIEANVAKAKQSSKNIITEIPIIELDRTKPETISTDWLSSIPAHKDPVKQHLLNLFQRELRGANIF